MKRLLGSSIIALWRLVLSSFVGEYALVEELLVDEPVLFGV